MESAMGGDDENQKGANKSTLSQQNGDDQEGAFAVSQRLSRRRRLRGWLKDFPECQMVICNMVAFSV